MAAPFAIPAVIDTVPGSALATPTAVPVAATTVPSVTSSALAAVWVAVPTARPPTPLAALVTWATGFAEPPMPDVTAVSTGASVRSHIPTSTWVSRMPSAMAWWKRVITTAPTWPLRNCTGPSWCITHSGCDLSNGTLRWASQYARTSSRSAGSSYSTRIRCRSRSKSGSGSQAQPSSASTGRQPKTGNLSSSRSWTTSETLSQSGSSIHMMESITIRLLGRSIVSHRASWTLIGRRSLIENSSRAAGAAAIVRRRYRPARGALA